MEGIGSEATFCARDRSGKTGTECRIQNVECRIKRS